MGLRVNWFTQNYDSAALGVERLYVPFGGRGSRFFFLSPNGSTDWFAALSGGQHGATVTIKNAFSSQQRSLSFGNVPTSNLPKPVHQPRGGDLLAFYQRSGGSTLVIFKNLSGHTIESVTLPGTGEFLTGNFTDDPGDEIAVRSGSTFTFHNPLNGNTVSMQGPSGGTAYDSINIGKVP